MGVLMILLTELSEVLWSMVFRIGTTIDGFSGCVVIFLVFMPWAVLTVGILLLMEGLSAFLHTIRLHWLVFI
jgi:V-type H+-transporting ATPase subunit a